MVSIVAFQAVDPGLIPGRRTFFFCFVSVLYVLLPTGCTKYTPVHRPTQRYGCITTLSWESSRVANKSLRARSIGLIWNKIAQISHVRSVWSVFRALRACTSCSDPERSSSWSSLKSFLVYEIVLEFSADGWQIWDLGWWNAVLSRLIRISHCKILCTRVRVFKKLISVQLSLACSNCSGCSLCSEISPIERALRVHTELPGIHQIKLFGLIFEMSVLLVSTVLRSISSIHQRNMAKCHEKPWKLLLYTTSYTDTRFLCFRDWLTDWLIDRER